MSRYVAGITVSIRGGGEARAADVEATGPSLDGAAPGEEARAAPRADEAAAATRELDPSSEVPRAARRLCCHRLSVRLGWLGKTRQTV